MESNYVTRQALACRGLSGLDLTADEAALLLQHPAWKGGCVDEGLKGYAADLVADRGRVAAAVSVPVSGADRVHMTVRAEPAVKAALVKAAEARGVSLSTEAAERLAGSLRGV